VFIYAGRKRAVWPVYGLPPVGMGFASPTAPENRRAVSSVSVISAAFCEEVLLRCCGSGVLLRALPTWLAGSEDPSPRSQRVHYAITSVRRGLFIMSGVW